MRYKFCTQVWLFIGVLLTGALGCSSSPDDDVEPPPIPRSGAFHGFDRELVEPEISGSPLSIAHLIQGGLRADYGSHFGYKVIVDGENAASGSSAVANLAYGTALNTVTRVGGMVDRSWFVLRANDGELYPVTNRSVHFSASATTTEGKIPGSRRINTETCTPDTNLMVFNIVVENNGSQDMYLAPHLMFDCDPYPFVEQLEDAAFSNCPNYTLGEDDIGTVVLGTGGQNKIFRQIWAFRRTLGVGGAEALDLQAEVLENGSVEIRIPEEIIPGSGLSTYTFFVGFGASEEEAVSIRQKYNADPISLNPAQVCSKPGNDFDIHLASLPTIFDKREKRLQRLAVDALRQARYAPRGGMGSRTGVVEAKPLHIRFDAGLMARVASLLGLWDTGEPLEYFKLMVVAADNQFGALPPLFDDNLQPASQQGLVADPILAWALNEAVAMNPNVYTTADIDPLFQGIVRIMAALEDMRSRDTGYYTALGEEGIWQDSPRFLAAEDGVSIVQDVSRTAWMGRAYADLAALADAMSLGSDADALRSFSNQAIQDLGQVFYDSSDGVYLDRIIDEDNKARFSTVRTPASIVPSALGLSGPTGYLASLSLILDGDALWGRWESSNKYMMPIPSVAYHDPYLNVLEDGHRVQGQVWPWMVYMAWRALMFAERFDEGEILRNRFLKMVDKYSGEGLYECYDFYDGSPGFGPQGRIGENQYAPPIIQSSTTAVVVLRLIYRL
ncbi:MAG: hypothetical protein CMH54_04520 [Myxococcales bacterium]|nr:hypothetical protein [Myxococcales bacterium]|tara:strand:+ start:957 stop:3140 length:2184 start_codon:yes stop_codon:yes gene_type:complete